MDVSRYGPRPPAAEGKGRRRRGYVILLALALLLALLLASLLRGEAPPGYNPKMEPNAVSGVMPGKSQELLQQEMDQQAQDKQVTVTVNSEIVFASAQAEGNILFENSSINEGKLLRLELYLGEDDSGTMIYETGYLRPGSYVPSARLDVELEPGSYACTAYVYVNRESDERYLGRLAVGNINVIIQS